MVDFARMFILSRYAETGSSDGPGCATNFMLACLAAVLFAGVARGQSSSNQIVCAEGATGAACRSFKDAVEDEDRNIVKAAKRDHVIVCFRPKHEAFLLLSYDSPKENLWHERENSSRGLEQAGSFDFLLFRNGNANFGCESVMAVGFWVAEPAGDKRLIRFSGTSLVPGDDGTARIDSEGIYISHFFKEGWNDPLTHYEFSMKNSAQDFVETFVGPIASTVARGQTENSGKCFTYK
jgi:hypothetical protein